MNIVVSNEGVVLNAPMGNEEVQGSFREIRFLFQNYTIFYHNQC